MESYVDWVIIAILIEVIFIVIDWFVAKEFYNIVKMKGYDEKKYFWYCFWLGFVGYAMVIALPNRNNYIEKQEIEKLPDL